MILIFLLLIPIILLTLIAFASKVHYIYRCLISPESWDKTNVKFNSKENVIIFTAYDLEYLKKPFVIKNAEIINKYAEKHDHVYKQIIIKDNDLPVYWIRVKYLKELLNKTPDNTLIAYFDADAIPIHNNISIPDFITSIPGSLDYDIFISEDPDVDNIMYTGKYNTGVFIVRNTPKSRKFVDEWLNKYNSDKWKKDDDNSQWKCIDEFLGQNICQYGGIWFEQGAFSSINSNIVKGLNSTTLACNSINNDNDNCFAMHLMGDADDKRNEIFSNFLR